MTSSRSSADVPPRRAAIVDTCTNCWPAPEGQVARRIVFGRDPGQSPPARLRHESRAAVVDLFSIGVIFVALGPAHVGHAVMLNGRSSCPTFATQTARQPAFAGVVTGSFVDEQQCSANTVPRPSAPEPAVEGGDRLSFRRLARLGASMSCAPDDVRRAGASMPRGPASRRTKDRSPRLDSGLGAPKADGPLVAERCCSSTNEPVTTPA